MSKSNFYRDACKPTRTAASQIAHTVDLYGRLVPGRLEGLRATFDAAVSAAQQQPAPTPPAEAAQRLRLRLVT